MLLSNINVISNLKYELEGILKDIEQLKAVKNTEQKISIVTTMGAAKSFYHQMPMTEDLFTVIMLNLVSRKSRVIKELEKLNVTVDVK